MERGFIKILETWQFGLSFNSFRGSKVRQKIIREKSKFYKNSQNAIKMKKLLNYLQKKGLGMFPRGPFPQVMFPQTTFPRNNISPNLISPSHVSLNIISPSHVSPSYVYPNLISSSNVCPNLISPSYVSPNLISPSYNKKPMAQQSLRGVSQFVD
jgi:hypothetical protein